MLRNTTTFLLALSMSCGAGTSPNLETSTGERSEPRIARFPEGDALLAESDLRGAFVVRAVDSADTLAAHPDLAGERFVPASTFKIPNALIALETGVVSDASFTLPWDGTSYSIDAWNRDHDLTTALEASVVWFFQEVARRIGRERMSDWVSRFDYGNGEVGEQVDNFWLEGPLAISAFEQVRFLERLNSGELPVSDRSLAILRQAMPHRRAGSTMIRAKTGTQRDAESCLAWLVGWTETDGEVTAHFALLLIGEEDDIRRFQSVRWDLAERLLDAAQAADR